MSASRGLRSAALLGLVGLAGCSVVDPAQRRTVDWCDAHLAPSAPAAQYALLPLAMPVGWLAYATDAAVVNPLVALESAWLDTEDLLWRPRDESDLRRALFVPLAVLATPVVFAGDWVGRCIFPVRQRTATKQDGGR